MNSVVGAFRAHPVAAIWVGMLTYSTGPVMVASSAVSGAEFSLMRLLVGIPILAVPAMFTRLRTRRPTSLRVRLWTGAAGVMFALHQLTFMTAVKLTSVADVVLMNTLAPIIVMLLAVPIFGERPDRRVRGWTALAMLGGVIIAIGGATTPGGDPVGVILAALNVVFFAGFFLFSKVIRPDADVWPFLFEALLVSAAVVICWFVMTGQNVFVSADRTDWALAVMMAAGPGAVGHFFMTWPLQWVRASVPPTIRLLQPLSAGGLAWIVLGERVSSYQFAGGLIAIAGVLGVLGALPRTLRVRGRIHGSSSEGSPPIGRR
jgi:drug/metabolite transporter (DMT)-like permease